MAFLSLRTHESDAKFVSYPLWEIEHAARKLEDYFEALKGPSAILGQAKAALREKEC